MIRIYSWLSGRNFLWCPKQIFLFKRVICRFVRIFVESQCGYHEKSTLRGNWIVISHLKLVSSRKMIFLYHHSIILQETRSLWTRPSFFGNIIPFSRLPLTLGVGSWLDFISGDQLVVVGSQRWLLTSNFMNESDGEAVVSTSPARQTITGYGAPALIYIFWTGSIILYSW